MRALGLVARIVIVIAAMAILLVTPVWVIERGGYAVAPVWWPDRATGVLLTGAVVDALAVAAAVVAILWPRFVLVFRSTPR